MKLYLSPVVTAIYIKTGMLIINSSVSVPQLYNWEKKLQFQFDSHLKSKYLGNMHRFYYIGFQTVSHGALVYTKVSTIVMKQAQKIVKYVNYNKMYHFSKKYDLHVHVVRKIGTIPL